MAPCVLKPGRVLLAEEGPGQVTLGLCIVRLHGQRLLERGSGLLVLLRLELRRAEEERGLPAGVVRVRDHLRELLDRAVELAGVVERGTEAGAEHQVVRPQRAGLLEGRHGAGGVLLHRVLHVAELVLRLGVLCLELDRLLQLGERRRGVAAGDLHARERQAHQGRVGVLVAQLLEVLHGEIDLPFGQHLQRTGRLDLDHQRLGLRIVVGHRRRQVGVAQRLLRAPLCDLGPRHLLVGLDGARRSVDHLLQHRLGLGRAAGLSQHRRQPDHGTERLHIGRHCLAVGGLGARHVSLGRQRMTQRGARTGAAACGDGLLRQRHGLVRLALVGAAVRDRDRRPHTLGVGGERRFGVGRRFGHAARVLHDRHPCEGLGLGGPAGLVGRRLVGVDRQVELAPALAQRPEADAHLGVAGAGLVEDGDRSVGVPGRQLRLGSR